MHKSGIAFVTATLVGACGGFADKSDMGEPTPSSTTGMGEATQSSSTSGTPNSVTTYAVLPLSQAPAATQSFFWGSVNLSAPGFYGPPVDVLTISLDDNSGGLRYLSFAKLPMLPKVFGDGPGEYPLTGTANVIDPESDVPGGYDVTVLDSPAPTSDHFLLSYRVVNSPYAYDYVESTEGTSSGAGWAITYSLTGTLDGANIDAQASGTIYAGDPTAPTPAPGQAATWSAPVELSAPGFYGPPVDHLTVATDGENQIQSLAFERFPIAPHTFGDGPGDFPLSGTASVGGDTIAVDMTDPPNPDHFVLRYHVQGDIDDYEEGIDGTRVGSGLVVRYFIQGTLQGATIDGQAAGTLAPADSSLDPDSGAD